jgi:hypothetical protein
MLTLGELKRLVTCPSERVRHARCRLHRHQRSHRIGGAASAKHLVMRTERLASHNEAREALVLSVAGVTAIMLTVYLLLLILY